VNLDDVKALPGVLGDYIGFEVNEGDLLFTRYSGNADLVGACGVVPFVSTPTIHPDKLIRGVVRRDLADPRFIALAVNCGKSREYIDEQTKTTAGQVGISGRQLKATPVPLPPLVEQQRIVAKVDELMRLIDDFEAKLAKKREVQARLRTSALDALTMAERPEEVASAWERVTDSFDVLFERADGIAQMRRSILEQASRGRLTQRRASDEAVESLWNRIVAERTSFDGGRRRGRSATAGDDEEAVIEPHPVPTGWRWCRLADVAGHIVDGTHRTPKYTNTGIPFISAKDIAAGAMSFDRCRYISGEEFEILADRCRPKRGDVLVQKSGSIGEVAVVDTDRPFTLFESVALIPVVPSVDPRFIAHVTHLAASGSFGREHQKGIGVTHLHLVDLRRLPIPLPPPEEQRRIVAKVDALMKLCDDLEAKLGAKEATAKRLAQAVVAKVVA
jgi:type I restriction enzyme S subunit